jgi:DNA polymerase III epsilon subunit-like protein
MIVLDIETTGLSPILNSIIEIGAIDFSNTKNQFQGQCHIWAGAEVDTTALKINGFTNEEITRNNKPTEFDLLQTFIKWLDRIEDRTICGQNIDFDIGFLNESAKRYKIDRNFGKRKVDLHSLVYSHLLKRNVVPLLKNGLSNISSDFIMEYVGLPAEPKPHRAINGAKWETEAISRLIYGKSILEEFFVFDVPAYLKTR